MKSDQQRHSASGPAHPAQNWNWVEIREIEPITSSIHLLNHHQMQIGGLNIPFWGSGMDQFISQIILKALENVVLERFADLNELFQDHPLDG